MSRALAKLILLTLFIASAVQCNQTGSYQIRGNALGYPDHTRFYLYQLDQDNQPIALDTLVVQNGTFSGQYPYSEESSLSYIKLDDQGRNVVFFIENQDLTITVDREDPAVTQLKGGKINTAYYDYLNQSASFQAEKTALTQAIKTANAQQDDLLARELGNDLNAIGAREAQYLVTFMDAHLNSLLGLMLLNEIYNEEGLNPTQVSDYLAVLSPKFKNHPIAKSIQEQLSAVGKNEIGAIAAKFEAPTPEGTMLSLDQAMGQYTLIDFWASWCRPCRVENPNVVRAYSKYHERGLNIISVSLDREGQEDRWVKAIADDQMDWFHVSNLQFWQEPIAREYWVRSIPQTFLIDAQGRIIDKNLRGAALEARLEQLMPRP